MKKYLSFFLTIYCCNSFAATNNNYLWSATNTQTQFWYDAANHRFTNAVYVVSSNAMVQLGMQDNPLSRQISQVYSNYTFMFQDSASANASLLSLSNNSGAAYIFSDAILTPTIGLRDNPYRANIIERPKWKEEFGQAQNNNVAWSASSFSSPYSCISNALFRVTANAICTNAAASAGSVILAVRTYAQGLFATNVICTLPLQTAGYGVGGSIIVTNNGSGNPLAWIYATSGYSSGTAGYQYKFYVEQLE